MRSPLFPLKTDERERKTYQGRNEIDAWHVVDVVDFDVAANAFVATTLDGALEYMSVVKVLHGLRAKIDAEVLQLARLGILEPKHVQDADETVGGVPHSVIQRGHASGSCPP